MRKRFILQKKTYYFMIFTLIAITFNWVWQREWQRMEQQSLKNFQLRAHLLEHKLMLKVNFLQILKNIAEDPLSSRNVDITAIQTYPDHSWGLTNKIKSSYLFGSARGFATPLTAAVLDELQMILKIDPLLETFIITNPNIPFIYYTSVQNFRYLAPVAMHQDIKINPRTYQHAIWLQSGPEQNPDGKLTISKPYYSVSGASGAGQVITLTMPVTYKNQFSGILSMDLMLESLEELLTIGEPLGLNQLIDEQGNVIIEAGRYTNSIQKGGLQITGDAFQYRAEVIAGQLYLEQKISLWLACYTVAKASLPAGLGLLLLLASGIIALNYRSSLQISANLMLRDSLTGTLNRRGFYARAAQLQAQAHGRHLLIALFDIDHFKKVNDIHGHEMGDQVIVAVADSLSSRMRDVDLVCRWGGEEFIIILTLHDPMQATAIVERQRSQVSETLRDLLPITLSGGLVLLRQNESFDTAIARADQLLYQAKHNGRNQLLSDLSEV